MFLITMYLQRANLRPNHNHLDTILFAIGPRFQNIRAELSLKPITSFGCLKKAKVRNLRPPEVDDPQALHTVDENLTLQPVL